MSAPISHPDTRLGLECVAVADALTNVALALDRLAQAGHSAIAGSRAYGEVVLHAERVALALAILAGNLAVTQRPTP